MCFEFNGSFQFIRVNNCWVQGAFVLIFTVLFELQKFTVPQRFFSHFYVVAVGWTTLLLLSTWIYAYKMAPIVSEPFSYSDLAGYLAGRSNIFSFHRSRLIPLEHKFRVWLSVFLLLLMEVQVLRRLFETVCVFNYSPSARMHIFGYFTGLQ